MPSNSRALRAFGSYAQQLSGLAQSVLEDGLPPPLSDVVACLDGQPSHVLQRTVEPAFRRASGLFLTGQTLADFALRSISIEGPLWDPACGAGDLLLAAARKLPLQPTLHETIQSWSESLYGFDIHAELVAAARARLVLLAWARGAHQESGRRLRYSDAFRFIVVGDGRRDPLPSDRIRHVLLNPPFMQAFHDSTWGRGRATVAAMFVDRCMSLVPEGVTITAILPDSLRSGSRYERWRREVETLTLVNKIRVWGLFKGADVDVFVVDLARRAPDSIQSRGLWTAPPHSPRQVGDNFRIHVGPVVTHRLDGQGPWRRFIDARTLRDGKQKSIRWGGRTFQGPLVLVRRTSGPKDKIRARAEVLLGASRFAIENHLLVLVPLDGSVAKCERAVEVLSSESTTRLLNARIRCRHLTVSSVTELPWNE